LPSLQLSGCAEGLGEVPVDVGAQDEGAHNQDQRVQRGPQQVKIGSVPRKVEAPRLGSA
jgi:hypothetical protein